MYFLSPVDGKALLCLRRTFQCPWLFITVLIPYPALCTQPCYCLCWCRARAKGNQASPSSFTAVYGTSYHCLRTGRFGVCRAHMGSAARSAAGAIWVLGVTSA